uniref:Mucosa-associated lymphoid tissue lymphoma translocation protein 1-like n=1 Tax=Nothoprocta perdicaria TaxID=30464 RepID=A0A8C6ZVX8_NOTPE
MAEWSMSVGSLGEDVVAQLCELLDTASRGWRKLAEVAGAEKRFKCSEEELEMCSLKVLEPRGSPTQCLLQLLAERDCSLKYLLACLDKMGHAQACQVLSGAVQNPIHITVQPESRTVAGGTQVALTCWASGPPGLSYQWFCGKQELPGATAPELVVDTGTSQGQPGWYICRVNCGVNYTFSRWAHVQVERSSSPSSGGKRLLPDHGGAADPAAAAACRAMGNPPPQYQWFRNRQPVEGARAPQLQVKLVTTAERGSYSCRVFNLFHEVWSREVEVEIGPRLFNSGGSWQDRDRDGATDKVALLIGNMHYVHHKHLKAPMVDVHALSSLLRQLDFKVVSLLDLCKAEMQMAVNEFLLLLDKGVYGLLYYAGHGYENFGNSFMVPIDAPSSYTSAHCLCVQRVLRSMQQRHTALNIFLLDMCRKRNLNDNLIPQVGALQVTANIVFGYATCADAEAYELSQGELSNGIFMSFLKRWLVEDEKITVLLDKVAEDMGTLEITRGRQALELRSNLSERRALTDPIQPAEGQEESSVRNLQWAKAHVLPESRHLCFDCGVAVQLGFAAEFSNIMIIYTRIVATPKEIARCEAKLTDIPEELDADLKFTNRESPEELGSPLSPTWSRDVPSCCLYSRLCGLQKLRQELVFTVCLQYQYRGMEDFVEERRAVNVGKPLIAKLNLRLGDGDRDAAGDASASPPGSEASGSPLSGSLPGSWATGAHWLNAPEETPSPDTPDVHSL